MEVIIEIFNQWVKIVNKMKVKIVYKTLYFLIFNHQERQRQILQIHRKIHLDNLKIKDCKIMFRQPSNQT